MTKSVRITLSIPEAIYNILNNDIVPVQDRIQALILDHIDGRFDNAVSPSSRRVRRVRRVRAGSLSTSPKPAVTTVSPDEMYCPHDTAKDLVCPACMRFGDRHGLGADFLWCSRREFQAKGYYDLQAADAEAVAAYLATSPDWNDQ